MFSRVVLTACLLGALLPLGSRATTDPLVLQHLPPTTELVEAAQRIGLEADDLSLRQAQAILDERYDRQQEPLVGAVRNYLIGLWHYRRNHLAEAEQPLAAAHTQFLKLHVAAAAGETALLLGWNRWRQHDAEAAERWLRRAVHLAPPDNLNLQLGCLILAGALHPDVTTARAVASSVDLLALLRPHRPSAAPTQMQLPVGVVLGSLLALLLVGGGLFLRYKRRQQAVRRALEQQNEVIHQQKEELEAQSDKLRQHRDELNVTVQQLLEAYAELRELGKFKDALTGMIVHDLKSPLNAILLNASARPELPEMIAIHQAARQMLNLTLNLLDVQRYENSQLPVQRVVLDLHQLCRDALDQVVVTARQKQIRLELQGTTRLRVDFDPDLAVRVLVNLLTNAIKYSPAGTRVQLRAERRFPNDLRLYVRDEGPGIPVQLREAIFDKYVQLRHPEAPKSGLPSTGLGLTFCRMAVEAHGGRIWVEDPPSGPGSVFVIDLPSAVLPEQQPAPAEKTLVLDVSSEFSWTPEALRLAQPVAQQLVGIEPYQFGQIQDVIDTLPGTAAPVVREWAQALRDAALAGNVLHYRLLVTQPLRQELEISR